LSRRPRFGLTILSLLLLPANFSFAADDREQKLNREFQSAVAQYKAGQYPQAAAQLEELLPQLPKNFEIQELLGLVYASESQNKKAIEHLQAAVELKPNSPEARTNLAATFSHAGRFDLAGEQFRKALELEPHNYNANHNLGEFYIHAGKIADALPLLEEAQRVDSTSYDNGYDLSLAYFLSGRLDAARQLIDTLIAQKNSGELHNLLGEVEEKDGKFVAAAKEFEIAAQMEPSEENLFDLACEFLLHRTYDPAIEVYQKAIERYPNSARLRIGLGVTLYSRGQYDEAVKSLVAAADLTPDDPRCYLFLSKAYDSSLQQADEVIQRFRRYAELEPRNGLAQYYYAMSLWKGKRTGDSNVDIHQVEALLQKSIALDPSLAEAHVQLADLYDGQHAYDKSIPQYVRALELNQNLPDAHYRLGQDYIHTGRKDQAQAEFAIYQKQRAEHMAVIDKEKADVQQFVYAAKTEPASKP
jgi:tetratricopeptide (TPR) repeat protein